MLEHLTALVPLTARIFATVCMAFLGWLIVLSWLSNVRKDGWKTHDTQAFGVFAVITAAILIGIWI